jgi:hypothetical protein
MTEAADSERTLAEAQLLKLKLEIRKLQFDVDSLGSTGFQVERVVRFIPLITVIIAVAGFWFTVHQYNQQQRAAADKQAADREQSLLRPVWEKRLELYFTAAEAAATIALSSDKTERDRAEAKFSQLYAGPMIIVEDAEVEQAMIRFNNGLTGHDSCDQSELHSRSLKLASAARTSIGHSFNIKLGDLEGKY